jgi:hypothetical protein
VLANLIRNSFVLARMANKDLRLHRATGAF